MDEDFKKKSVIILRQAVLKSSTCNRADDSAIGEDLVSEEMFLQAFGCTCQKQNDFMLCQDWVACVKSQMIPAFCVFFVSFVTFVFFVFCKDWVACTESQMIPIFCVFVSFVFCKDWVTCAKIQMISMEDHFKMVASESAVCKSSNDSTIHGIGMHLDSIAVSLLLSSLKLDNSVLKMTK